MTQSSQQKLLALATVAIIALLGLAAFLTYNKVKLDKLIKQQNAELVEETRLKAELEKEYYQALSDLEEMRSSNSELNAMIETQKAELKKQKDKIDGLIKSKQELEKAREEIAKLRVYVTEVEELRKKNAELQQNNLALSGERDELVLQVQQEKVTNEELNAKGEALSSQNEQLQTEKDKLARKVDIASSIKVSDIKATAYRVKNSGKEADTKKAKIIDGVKVSFTTTNNPIVAAGKERFYLRIINPLGEVMAIQDLGSGHIKNGATGESIQYTQYADVDYSSEAKEFSINWQPGIPFDSGDYKAEIYNKGYLAGKATFTLK